MERNLSNRSIGCNAERASIYTRSLGGDAHSDLLSLRPPLPVIVLAGASCIVLADSLRLFGLQGHATVLLFGLAFVPGIYHILLRKSANSRSSNSNLDRRGTIALTIFVSWAAASISWGHISGISIQNLMVYGIFLFALSIMGGTRLTPDLCRRLLQVFRTAGALSGVVYLALVLVSGPNNSEFYGSRSIAGALLPATAAAVALIAAGDRSVNARFQTSIILFAILLSLSRSATAVALGMVVALALVRGRSVFSPRVLASGIGVATAVYVSYQNYAPFRNRFQAGDGYEILGFTIGSSGRAQVWAAVISDIRDNAWFGSGAGSSQDFVASTFGSIGHPHNDYLRLLQDFGVVGLGLWLAFYVLLARAVWVRYRVSSDFSVTAIHLAALLGLLGHGIMMVANNPMVVVFGMLPLAVLLGASQAAANTCQSRW
ncbi:MAG: O-antigen ligase family protein [Sporichthyaceae bacterium]